MEADDTAQKIRRVMSGRLNLSRARRSNSVKASSRLDVFFDQIVDSIIVGGITRLSAYIAAWGRGVFEVWSVSLHATFLIKMKEYRKNQ